MSAPGATLPSPDAGLVVDASVAIKWHVPEAHSDAALRLFEDAAPSLHAPDLMFIEANNVAWMKVRKREITEDEARAIGRAVTLHAITVHPGQSLLEPALEIALAAGRTVYDSLYIALAVRLNCRLVTADERLYNALQGGPFAGYVVRVQDDLT